MIRSNPRYAAVLLTSLLGLSAALGACSDADPVVVEPAPVRIKVMEFNIEYGGKWVSFEKVLEAIALEQPDIIGLQEGFESVREVAEELGYPYYDHEMQVVSRYPLLEPQDSDHTHVLVEVAPGRVIAVSNVHLDSEPYAPYLIAEGKTAAEVIAIEEEYHVAQLASHWVKWESLLGEKVPVIALGDFNIPSHLDWTPEAVKARPELKFAVEWPVSKRLASMGFEDSYRVIYPDPVAKPGMTWWAARPELSFTWNPDPTEARDRIDFIYAGGPAHTVASMMIGEQGAPESDKSVTPWPTDHRATVSTFDVTPAPAPTLIAIERRFVRVGESVTVSVRNRPEGAAQFDVVSVKDGGKVASLPLAADAESVAVDSAQLSPGDYTVRVVDAPGATLLESHPFTVLAKDAKPAITLDAASYAVGDTLTVTYSATPGCRWDWVGVYEEMPTTEMTVDNVLLYAYAANGQATGALVGGVHGSVDVPLTDLESGKRYVATFITSESTIIARSEPFTMK